MNMVLPFVSIRPSDRERVGGKAGTLSRLLDSGFRVPPGACVTTEAYRQFIGATGLSDRIAMELHRKDLKDMRWEEMWDMSLRIRHLFLKAAWPESLAERLIRELPRELISQPAAVRSSAPGEDSARASFAGLHESFVNVRGEEALLHHIRLVWASLWSDAAVLYRTEIGLDPATSAMAVIIQQFQPGDSSGVVFSRSPIDPALMVIESVYGLNQGLVDGSLEPDRWILNRESGVVKNHTAPNRESRMVPSSSGIGKIHLNEKQRQKSPLSAPQIREIHHIALKCEQLLSGPQDVEWTFRKDTLYILQARPVTTLSQDGRDDTRTWYLSLRRSFDNLQGLRHRIETDLIPKMNAEAHRLSEISLEDLDSAELAAELGRRQRILKKWQKSYRRDFIPFAHGFRLFGQVYNDRLQPEDPYEFIDLLRPDEMLSLERNALLEEMAGVLQGDLELVEDLKAGRFDRIRGHRFLKLYTRFQSEFGHPELAGANEQEALESFSGFILNWSKDGRGRRLKKTSPPQRKTLEKALLARFPDSEQDFAQELIDLGRASYRLRDDDNLHLARIERQFQRAVAAGRGRLGPRLGGAVADLSAHQVGRALQDPEYHPRVRRSLPAAVDPKQHRDRQIRGQPAGKGLASGPARVVHTSRDLLDFRRGEVLVCDAVEPEMTFIVPLAAAIVERRGGMLIHGAIIAREYGIPCVTGIPDLDHRVRTGDRVTVDGYLGVLILD